MTLIAISCQKKHAQILTDTAAYTPNLRHLYGTSKVTHWPHLDTALVAGGLPEFAAVVRYVFAVSETAAKATDFDSLVELAPELMAQAFKAHLGGNPAPDSPSVIFLVGNSAKHGQFIAYELGSTEDFAPQRITGTYLHPTPWHLRPSQREYDLLLKAYTQLGAHPEVIADIRDTWLTMPTPDPNISPADLAALARQTREDRSMGGGIPIHGELIHTSLRPGKATTRIVWKFPDSGPDFERFVERTDHPVAQAADCNCGSGLNILSCCRATDLEKPCRCHSGELFKDCCLVAATTDSGEAKRARGDRDPGARSKR